MTLDSTPPTTASYTVAVVGAGPAGCAAGVFCARAGLNTVVFTNGRSTLHKCVFLENYLGFPSGIAPRDLLELATEHAREAGCTIRDETVEVVRRGEKTDSFEMVVDGDALEAEYVIAASWSTSEYLNEVGVETEPEEPGPIAVIPTDDDGATNVDGIYAAGRITSTHHQALVNAGDGARVALNLINAIVPDFYNDWVAPKGYYASYDREVPTGVEEIDQRERRRRVKAGRKRMAEYFAERREETARKNGGGI